MGAVFRNHFLHLACLGLVLFLLAGCAARQAAPPPPPSPLPLPPVEAPVSRVLLPTMGHAIQVGAFAKVDNAYRLCAKLISQGLSAYYFRGDKGLYRVRFGNYPAHDKALAVAGKLRAAGMIDVFTVIRPESYPAMRLRGQEEAIRGQLLSMSQQFIGVPYQWGGNGSPVEGFDCSGLVMMIYQLIGLDMPRVSKEQFQLGREVGREQLRPGDLVFFSTDRRGQVSHVGIYQGDGHFIHAPRSGKAVSRASLSSDYFHKRFLGARSFF